MTSVEVINALKPGAPLDREFTRIVRVMLRELKREFKRLQDGDLEAIHDLRKWLKRFRGFLRLYRPALGGSFATLDLAARDIARLLAGARDLQAMTEALALLSIDEPGLLRSPLARRLSRSIGGRPGDEPMRGAIDIDLAAAAFRRFRRDAKHARITESGFEAIAPGLAKTYRRTRQAFDEAQLAQSAEAFHILRRHANYHRLHMRVLAPCWPELMDVRAEAGSRLHDTLGEEHDLYVLAQWAKAAAADERLRKDARLIAVLAKAQRLQLQGQAMRIASQLFAERPSRFVRRIEKYWTAAG